MLTRLLKDNPDMAEELKLLSIEGARQAMGYAERVAPPVTENYATVGTASDYLFRWEVERRNPLAKDRPWVASLAVEMLNHPTIAGLVPPDTARIYRRIVEEATTFHAEFVKVTEPTDEMVRRAATLAICLAPLDQLFRAGIVTEDPSQYDERDVDDVVRVYRVADWPTLAGDATNVPLLNPEFGEVSKMFNGADADIIVGSTLLDFKCTKNWTITPYLAQITAYGMIADRFRATEDPTFPVIHRAGIYFARHATAVTFDFDYVREHPAYSSTMERLFELAKATFSVTKCARCGVAVPKDDQAFFREVCDDCQADGMFG